MSWWDWGLPNNAGRQEKGVSIEVLWGAQRETRKNINVNSVAEAEMDCYSISVRICLADAVAREDTGTDKIITPVKLRPTFLLQLPQGEVNGFETLLEMELAVSGVFLPKIYFRHDIRSLHTTVVPRSRIPMRVWNVCRPVSKMEIITLLFSWDLLNHLGFSFAKYLAENFDSVKDSEAASRVKSCAYTSVTYSKVKDCAYTGVTYGDQNDDPIESYVDLSKTFCHDTMTPWTSSSAR